MAESGLRDLKIFRFQYYTCNIGLSTYWEKKMQLGGLSVRIGLEVTCNTVRLSPFFIALGPPAPQNYLLRRSFWNSFYTRILLDSFYKIQSSHTKAFKDFCVMDSPQKLGGSELKVPQNWGI
jgi:hypothetical protein